MPLYEYQCEACAHRFERIQKFSDPPIEVCPNCGGPVRKLLSSPAIQFKGSGWYITDYAKKSATKSDDGKNAKGAGSDATTSEGTANTTTSTGKTTSSSDAGGSGSSGSKTTSSTET